jgi:FkbM family methyltransferase
MNLIERVRILHRAWRYRLREEKESVNYLLGQKLNGATVLDIGANKGVYTYWMSKKVGNQGKVFAFEPQPELDSVLNDLRTSFALGNVEIINQGLSDRPGHVKMFRSKVGAGGGTLAREFVNQSELNGLQEVEVDLTTLDEFYRNRALARLDFIKCDVEGHELAVFKGGTNTLQKYQPTLLFECHHDHAQEGSLFSFLEQLGYHGFFLVNGKPVDARKFDQYPYRRVSMRHRNYIFAKAN